MEENNVTSQPLHKKWWFWVLSVTGGLVALFFLIMFQPWVLLPHEKIQISLPFAPEDDAYTSLIPMGETIEHNASNGTPDGHPGIDFGWQKVTNVLAVADGTIMNISKNENKYTIEQSMGAYRSVYQEMNTVETDIKRFSKVKKGQVLGTSGFYGDRNKKFEKAGPSGQIHWDFASSSMFIDRLCPLIYFDSESRARIEKIWGNVPANDQFKINFPKICNGIFDGKYER